MSIGAHVIDAMIAAGASADVIAAAWKADLAEQETRLSEKRAKDADRQRRHRASRNVTVTECDEPDSGFLDKKPQTQKINPSREVNSLPACATLDLPEGVSFELWDQYRAMRKKIRKPLSSHAEQLALKHLRKFAEDGHPPGPIVEAAIVGSYQGLFPPKATSNGRANSLGRNQSDDGLGRTARAAVDVFGVGPSHPH